MKTLRVKKEYIKRREKKQEEKRIKGKIKNKVRNKGANNRRNIVFKLNKTIIHHFPWIFDKVREIKDNRKRSEYEIGELIMGCIMMFVFKKGSRNAFNNERLEEEFRRNYKKVFGMRLPHMDTVDIIMRQLEEEEIEGLKKELVKALIENKILYKYRLFGKYYKVVIDGSHVMNVSEGHCENCLRRVSKKGNITYFHNVLEAKLVSENGFCISICTEWIENQGGYYEKQDCELKAFVRLSERLKRDYPRLPICIVADGLYPNQTFFEICERYGWEWIVTFKDGNIPSVWKEVLNLQKITIINSNQKTIKNKKTNRIYRWFNNIDYKGFSLNWFECIEEVDNTTTRFVYISSLKVDFDNILEITASGRIRWKIENEGFDTQKNHGYGLGHKFSRVSIQATKNYYQCMQIAHIFNQLFELSSLFKPLLIGKMTIKHIWNYMLGEMRHQSINIQELASFLSQKIQFRYG